MITFGYWQLRGLGERIRFLLRYLQIPYKQVLYTPQTSAQWFEKQKPILKQSNPAANLPYLLDEDKVICESQAIIIYIIYKSGKKQLLGRSPDQEVQMATVNGIFRDLYRQYLFMIYDGKPIQEQRIPSLELIRTQMTKLNAILGQKQFMCGQLTYPDFAIAETLQHLYLFQPPLKTQYPKLAVYQQRVWDLPGIKQFVHSQQFHERPVNYPAYAKWY